MKFKYITILSGAALLSVASCKKELSRINQNPNGSEVAQPDYLLTAATKATADTYWGVANNMDASLLFAQYWSKIQYTDPDRYIYASSAFEELWTTGYTKGIGNFNEIIKLADAQGNSNYKGVALVLRSWVFSLLTEAYGNIPYKQSVNIDQYLTPAYDSQKDVYFALLDDLKAAQAALNPSGKAIGGDVIYGKAAGNIALWKKFANSLRLRIALRIADREPAKAKQVLDDIKTDGSGYISANAETAQFVYVNSPNQNPVSNLFDTRDDYRISKTIVDKLFALNDPRLPIYASKTQDATPQNYVGLPNGLLVGDASGYGFTKTSKPGTYFRGANAPAVILSYAESLFDRAEAAARGFTTEDAASLYQQAVTAALLQYGVSATDIATYLAQPAVQYDASNYKKSIGEQKWIALFGQGLEGWTEWRRLDYPVLQPGPAATLNGKLPVRFIYPGSEQTLNKTSYNAAVASQGADALTTKLWFDVN
ncbi:SusD-like starch-binding protein associating with outer membrane [Mucilaginibacter oryzae]|uniref:SusD-like starch-binding protein associating with outer membrane n=1 Tax=Mucilaginibacter oryzae TaxID=468058 RepID=A0A316HBI7_9SPHI|nr:SusD/RagB family nutrient-binding outer membrane lipoprotein [Mucilaginibacter oryzae]PWK77653.1 SusD-like starch-binding protein associating with outer membrane [Mucilaginibacter oryzae]